MGKNRIQLFHGFHGFTPKSFPFNLSVKQKKFQENILTFTGFTKALNALHCVMHI